jgi:hypothetical protein
MSTGRKESKENHLFGSRRNRKVGPTRLPPKNYIKINNREEVQIPNLINIYRHEYKAKHFEFGTSLPSQEYQDELEMEAKHCTKMIRELRLTEKDLQWIGDTMEYQETWPIQRKTLRVAQLNVNGLSFIKDNFKIDMYLQALLAMQVDVAALQEINLNLNIPKIREKLGKAMRRFDQRATFQSAYNKNNESNRIYTPGGNAIWTSGIYTGRVKRKGQEKYGRWAYVVMHGRGEQEIMLISAYNVCKNATLDGSTIAGQLIRAMHKDSKIRQDNIRKKFFEDIQDFLQDEQRKGMEIVLAMDINTASTAKELQELKRNTGMVDVFSTKHPTMQHPKTYYRGQHCLDYIYATPYIAQGIERVGYAPFYAMGKYDHRMLYVDLKWDYIFNHKIDVTQARGRQLSVKNRRVTKLYLKTLKKLEKKAGIHKGLEEIRECLKNKQITKRDKEHCIKRIKNYKTIMIQLMINANKVATKSKPKIFQWSIALRKNGKQMRYWNERKRSSENGDSEGIACKIPSGYNPPIARTHDEVMDAYYLIQAEWIKTKDTSALLHHQFMVDLIEHIEESRGCSKETAQKLLYHQESSKAGHEQQSRYLKKKNKGLLTELLVPSPHTQDREAHIRITGEKDIEKILLRRNKTKLSEAVISPFCKGPLADMIDENGRCKVSTSIINGDFDVNVIDRMDVQHKKELKMLIRELARKRDAEGNKAHDVDTTISTQDFQKMFQKKNELTSCGPRGIIMPHWKMIAENEHLSTIQAWLMEAPFKYGFTYKEWEISVHCMLMKDKLPFYHRLRIIQLFEGDMNGALQLLFGKRQMQYMDEQGLNSDATYGGRKGKGCHQALNRIQYTILYSRTMRQSMGLVDVDATGCFDRMVGRLLSLINQCNGMTQQASSCQAEVLHNMRHYVKTTRGISENYIKRDKQTLLEGNGQGNAASVPGWHGHNELLCKVYRQILQGSKIVSPDKRVQFEQWLSSFIDDNKMLLSFDPEDTYETIINTCQKSLQTWEVLLNLTGGAVELKKCLITLMRYEESYKWYNASPGVPQLMMMNDGARQCTITRDGEEDVVIRQQNPTEGVKLLGVMAAANGTYKQEHEARVNKSKEIAGRLKTAPLSIALSWQAYYSRWKPAIAYCLPITTFSGKECKQIESPFYNVLLPKLGINRHMPRALLHGSPQVAGLGLVNLEAEQLAKHISGLITQVRKNDKVGQVMRASIDALQIYLGTAQQFFQQQAKQFEHRPKKKESQLVYMWEELNELGCELVSDNFWTPEKKGLNDVAIMDAIIEVKEKRRGTVNHLPKLAIWYANACRIYLKITMLHDITTPCGRYIYEWVLDGSKKNEENELVYPRQAKPPPYVWKVWRECVRATFLGRSETNQPTLYKQLERIEVVERRNWRSYITEGMRLEEAVKFLPGYIREALGTIMYPEDNGKQLSQELARSQTISWTDGTVKDRVGAHAYTIRTKNDNTMLSLSGVAATPGDCSTLTSLRAEHFGVYIVIVLLDIITLVHKNDTIGQHIHYTDSKAVITRLENTDYMTDRQYDGTDYDIWQETLAAIKNAKSVQFVLRHVKAHQRETMYEINKKQGPLSRAATYNDWCDNAANIEREQHPSSVQICFIKAAKIYLQTKHTMVTASAYTKIYYMKTEPMAEEYVRRKLVLTKNEQKLVNWEAMGNYMKNLAISQRIKVMKYIYDWQNVGTQKELHQWADTEEYMCPYKCGEKEGRQHYLVCSKSCDKMSRMCMEAINRWMLTVRTNNRVRVQIMTMLYENLPIKRQALNIQYEDPTYFDMAVDEQRTLGWSNTMKGLLSKKWGEIQETEYARIRKREQLEVWYTGQWWTKHLIKHIIFWALNEWQKRNEQLHQDIEQRRLEKTRRQCRDEILMLYSIQEQKPIARLKRYFRQPLIEKLQQNPNRQRQWIDTIQALSEKSAVQNSKNKL